MIIDMRRSGVNFFVRLRERIVLPRLWDVIADVTALLEHSGAKLAGDIDMMVIDWADAFHSIGVRPEEIPHQVVRGFNGQHIGYEAVLFGGVGSPLVWGRAAAFLGRSGA